MKIKIWKILAAAGSLAILSSCHTVMRPYAYPQNNGEEIVVTGPEQCKRILMELVSQTQPGEKRECRLTGRDYEPESLVIAQMFPDVINISNTKMKDDQKDGHRYVTCKISFERIQESKKSEMDEDEDGETIGRHWVVGEKKSLRLGNTTYQFRCVDDDYVGNSEYQRCALFLCDTVIRSDVDSSDSKREILTFGRTNNYKTSEIREWLMKHGENLEEGLVSQDTGVNSAYLGATVPGLFEEFSENGFWRHELPIQTVEDKLFLLSMEEAFLYRDELWEVEGGGTAYSRGYWLRTPVFSEGDTEAFCYGNWAYVVDLEQGCIRPADVNDASMGIRPAFCLPQI